MRAPTRAEVLAALAGWLSMGTATVVLVVVLGRPSVDLDAFTGGIVLLGWIAGFTAVRWRNRVSALAIVALILGSLTLLNSFNYFGPAFLLAFLLIVASLGLGVKRRPRTSSPR